MCFVVIQLKWTPENIQLWWEKLWNKIKKSENLNENFGESIPVDSGQNEIEKNSSEIFKNSKERGIYRTLDGGKNWKKVLYINERSGGNDITFEPGNPRIIYASTWNIRRTPYSLESGGNGSYLWKSTDEGNTWKNISNNDGLPKGIWGKIGIAVSPVNPNIVYALIENKNG